MHILHNGIIILEDRVLEGMAVIVEGERITDLIPDTEIENWPDAERIDANGGYITAGFVDIHSDYIETIVSPRPTSMMDFNMGLREAEKVLINHGITTMFHSLSFYGEDVFSHKPMRRPDNVQRLVDSISALRDGLHLIRHRLHARFEVDNIGEVDTLIRNIDEGKVHLLSFMDHTPGQGQYRDLEIYRNTLKGYRDISDEEVGVLIAERTSREQMTIERIREVAKMAISRGIAVASHDDDSVDKLELVRSFGTTISEFPVTLDVAKKAHEMNLATIVGAPNVLMGGSHSGNLSASEAILEGCADILCSDYYPAALLHSVFKLHDECGLPLHEGFAKVTIHPARAVNMADELGSVCPGKKADLLIIERMEDGYPMLTATMVNGVVVTRTNYRKS